MTNHILVIFSIFLCFSNSVRADEYNTRLRKISLLLTGQLPKKSDLSNLTAIKNGAVKENYIREKIKEYQSSEEYVQKMRERMEELLNVTVTHNGMLQSNDNGYLDERDIKSSMHSILTDLFDSNKSWDSLLVTKNYKFFFPDSEYSDEYIDPRAIDDIGFYSYNYGYGDANRQELLEYLSKVDDGNLAAGKDIPRKNTEGLENLAGIITTNRFFTRYPTTRINKNRKRAAAVFRMFLCDSMTPALLPSNKENMELLDLALGQSNNDNFQTMTEEQRHGQDPQCESCHHKLDPMARTFIGSGVVPNRKTTPGELVYYEENEKGQKKQIRVPVSGLGELGKVITEQPTYSQCQVTHFWNWFIGENIPLSYTQKISLSKKFDELERKPNDFIDFLLNSNDFKFPKKIDLNDIRYSHVQSIFKRCDSCHKSTVTAPTLSSGYPFAVDPTYNKFSLGQIIWASDLREETSNDFMPPRNAGWKLEGFERDLLKAWVKTGAKDDNGNATISTGEMRTHMIAYDPEFLNSNNFKFKNTSNRYMNNYDLINVLTQIYGESERCSQIQGAGHKVNLGFLNTSDGKSLFQRPNSALLNWIRECSSQSVLGNAKKHLPENIQDLLETNWLELSNSEKVRVIKFSIDNLIGQNVLEALREEKLLKTLLNCNQEIKQVL